MKNIFSSSFFSSLLHQRDGHHSLGPQLPIEGDVLGGGGGVRDEELLAKGRLAEAFRLDARRT